MTGVPASRLAGPAAEREALTRSSLRLLHIEDNESDAAMVLRVLERGGFSVDRLRIETEAQLRDALANRSWDLVIADYELPQFNAPAALQVVGGSGLDVPFIVISGVIGEDIAVGMMKSGAHDYVMKENLQRLVPAVRRELAEAHVRHEHRVAEMQVASAREAMDGLIESAMDAIVALDESRRIIVFNAAAQQMFGYSLGEVWLQPLEMLIPERLRPQHETHMRGFVESGDTSRRVGELVAVSGLRKGGQEFPVEISVAQISVAGERRYTAILRDVSGQVDTQKRITHLYRTTAMLSAVNSLLVRVRSRDELYRSVCRIAVDLGQFARAWVGVVDRQSTSLRWRSTIGCEAGFPERVLESMPPDLRDGVALNHRLVVQRLPAIFDRIRGAAPHERPKDLGDNGYFGIAWLPLIDGRETVAVLVLHANVAGAFDDSEIRLLKELAGDMSFALQHISQTRRLNFLSYYDSLTGLANRTLFKERLDQRLSAARSRKGRLALAVLGVERFKSINDTAGRHAGDAVLRHVADRLRRSVKDATAISRIGADYFAIAVDDLVDAEQIADRMLRLHSHVSRAPLKIDEGEIAIPTKIGIALFPDDAADSEQLLAGADAAVRQAKQGPEPVVFFDRRMTDAVAQQLRLENHLQHALRRAEFKLHYQPKIELATGRIIGLEALLRWQNPELGLVSPAGFVPLLEASGLIVDVGAWVVERAMLDRQEWLARGLQAPRVAVNVSPVQLRQSDFVQRISAGFVEQRGDGVEVEITESFVMEDVEATIERLERLRDLGVTLSIDDFGSGYSSLAYIARLPVQSLKIDRVFIATMLADPSHRAVVSSAISLAHSLGLEVVAEGVETRDVAAALVTLGCDHAQGYYYSRPVPADATEALLVAERLPVDASEDVSARDTARTAH
jgi:diguanylate cyclase (GGDEF)-like protein/PAS domain S-box-containing protein